jgi:hypothetical protein
VTADEQGGGAVFNIGNQQAGQIYNAGRDQTIEGNVGTFSAEAVHAIADLRSALDAVPLTAADRAEAERALDEAHEQAARPEPDKGKVASAVERAVELERGAGEVAAELAGPIKTLATWLGPAGAALLKLVL